FKERTSVSGFRHKGFEVRRSLWLRVQCRGSQGNSKTKRRPFPRRRFKFHGSVMPLQDLVSLLQTDAIAILLGSKVKLKHLLMRIFRDANSAVAYFGHHRIAFTMRR